MNYIKVPKFKFIPGQVIFNSIYAASSDEQVFFLEGDLKTKRAGCWVSHYYGETEHARIEFPVVEETLRYDETTEVCTEIIFEPGWRIYEAHVARYTFRAVLFPDSFEKEILHNPERNVILYSRDEVPLDEED